MYRGFDVGFPIQSDVDVAAQVLELLHYINISSHPLLSEVDRYHSGLIHMQRQVKNHPLLLLFLPVTKTSNQYFCQWYDSKLCRKSEVQKVNRNGESTANQTEHCPVSRTAVCLSGSQ